MLNSKLATRSQARKLWRSSLWNLVNVLVKAQRMVRRNHEPPPPCPKLVNECRSAFKLVNDKVKLTGDLILFGFGDGRSKTIIRKHS